MRINSFASPPRLIIWNFGLHGVWEFFQCLLFYDMSGFGFWKGAAWMLGATVADVVISLVLIKGTLYLHSQTPQLPSTPILITVGLLVATGIEASASIGNWWHYTVFMPQLKFAGITLGLFPLLQLALLPYFGAKFAKVKTFIR